jgi:hypothetical protein
MAGPTLDDIFYSEVDTKVQSEINRRKGIYSKGIQGSTSALADEEYRWLYRKTAYLTLRRLTDSETTVIYDINFGKPKMDIIYNNDPSGAPESDTRYRRESVKIGRDVTISSGSNTTTTGYSTLLGPTTAPLLDLYTPDKGFIATTLVEATIDTIGEGLAYTTKFSVKFIVHDRDKVSFYLENLMRPLTPIELGFGWSTEDNDPNRGFLRGTVTNFSFSANNDGSWNCMIEGYSNPALANSIPLTSVCTTQLTSTVTGRRTDFFPIYADNTYVAAPPQSEIDRKIKSANLININGGLGTVLSNLIENSSLIFDSSEVSITNTVSYDYDPSNVQYVTGFYVINMRTGRFLSPFGMIGIDYGSTAERVPQTYIRLDSLIHIINCILAYNLRLQKDTPIRVVIDSDTSHFPECAPEIMKTGPADFYKFAFPESTIGNPGFPYVDGWIADRYPTTLYYIGALLLNVEYVMSEFIAAVTNIKSVDSKTNPNFNTNTFIAFLNNLLKQLDVETGGMIQAACFTTDTEIIIKNINSIKVPPIKKDDILTLTAFTTNSVCREISVESEVSSEILTVAAVASNTETSIGNSVVNKTLVTEDGKAITLEKWRSYSDAERDLLRNNTTGVNFESVLKSRYLDNPKNIVKLIELYNESYTGFDGTNQEKNRNGEYLDAFLQEPFPTSHSGYVMRIQELYKLIFQGARQAVLEGDNTMWNSIFNLRTATFPIKLKIKLDGIHGFKQGNSITTNWLPTGYNSKNCYFTVLKISHTISNNDWYTELEAMYRIILP